MLKSVVRVPASIFDEYRALCFKYPKAMNFYMISLTFFFFMILNKGAEKISMRGEANSYEFKRRLRRLFIPYSLVGYQWRFPENK